MTPRDLFRSRVRPTPQAAPILILVLLAVLIPAAPPLTARVFATLAYVSVTPAFPATCDSVTLGAEGATRNSCDQLVGTEVVGPEPILDWMGPLPAFRTILRLTVREVPGQACVQVVTPYSPDFEMGRLPAGHHLVRAVERRYDANGALRDSSVVDTSFVVRGDSCSVPPCVLLGFSPFPSPVLRLPCDASATPGGEGCFSVDLGNTVSVGGVQLTIQITDPQGNPVAAGSFTPKSVATTDRSSRMEVLWEASGSAASIVLFPQATDAIVSPGRGPILHVCYAVAADTPAGGYRIVFTKSLVSDPDGQEAALCPTRRVISGLFCVGRTGGCDVDGDGVADIRDIIRIVRCALAGAACPDTIAARADCNGDGAIDVRDVICCVRKLLLLSPPPQPEPPASPTPTRIGFVGSASWSSPLSGVAHLGIQPAADFGAIEFDVTPPPGLRITSLRSEGSGGTLEWAPTTGGGARVVFVRDQATVTAPIGVAVTFEPTGSGGAVGLLEIENVRNATWDGASGTYAYIAQTVPVPVSPIAAAAVYAARPNPFSGATEIPFALSAPGRASLRVYDARGRLVRTLVDGDRPAGVSRAAWDGRDRAGRVAPTGIYFVKLNAAGIERTSRIMKLR